MLRDKALSVLSGIPFLLLILPKNRLGGVIVLCLWLGLCLLLPGGKKECKDHKPFAEYIFGLVVSLFFGLLFWSRWQNTERMRSLAVFLQLSAKQLCAILALLLCFGSLLFIMRCTGIMRETVFKRVSSRGTDLVFLALTAALVVTFVSRCSPFYPIQDWVDPNTMFSLGRGMLKGLVPYRDLYDHKGPLIVGFHALGGLISFNNFHGIWLLEIIGNFFFLLLLYRTVRLFFGRRALLTIPVLALTTYVSLSFVEGDSAEEFCLPLLTFGLYTAAKAIEQKRIPEIREGFWIGVTSGCIFWAKYSMIGFYAGWFFFLIQSVVKKEVQKFSRMLLAIFAGILTSSIPVILYFSLNHALDSLWKAYFYDNLHYYTLVESSAGVFRILLNFKNGLIRMWESYPAMMILFFAGVLWCIIRRHTNHALFLLLTMFSGFAVIFWGGVSFPYYVFIFSWFSVWGMMWLLEIPLLTKINIGLPAVCAFYVSMICVLILTPNNYLLRYELSDFPQYQVKNIIENSGIEDPSILHFGFLDAGFNLAAGLIPRQRFFCCNNLELPEMKTEQQRYIDESEPDFILTCHMPLPSSDNYQFVGSWPGDFKASGNSSQFFLYQKVPAAYRNSPTGP